MIEFQQTIRTDHGAEPIEKPTVAVQFVLLLLLETKDDLNGSWDGRKGGTKGPLEYVCSDSLAINGIFGDTWLVATHLHDASDAHITTQTFLSTLVMSLSVR